MKEVSYSNMTLKMKISIKYNNLTYNDIQIEKENSEYDIKEDPLVK